MTNLPNLLFFTHYKRQLPLNQLAVANSRLSGKLQVSAIANGREVPTEVEVTFMGPQDVKMIHPNSIARVVPFHGSKDFEANFFPYIEFKDPDFLWRYSQDQKEDPKPWLTLIALTEQEMIQTESKLKVLDASQQQLLVIPRGKDQLLPEKGNAAHTYSAHVQISPDPKLNPDQIHRHIQENPEKSCCRLFCFRRLQPQKHYHLFLVPSHELEEESSGAVELTVFFHSEFTTAQKGDFEFLARKIMPQPVDDANSTRAVWCEEESRELDTEAALAAPGYSIQRRKKHSKYYPRGYDQNLIDQLNETLNLSSADNEDPYIGLPFYGKMYQGPFPLQTSVYPSPKWSQEVNLDRRNRVAASLGTSIVQDNQEEYSRLSWQQVGDVIEANAIISRVYAGMLFNKVFEKRYNQVLKGDRRFLRSSIFHNQFKSPAQLGNETLDESIKNTALIPGSGQSAFLTRLNLSVGVEYLDLKYPWRNAGRSVSSRPGTTSSEPPPNQTITREIKKYHPYIGNRILDTIPQKPKTTPPLPVSTEPDFDLGDAVSENIDFDKDALDKINHRISPKRSNFEPIAVGPEIDVPMFEPLAKKSLDYILIGADGLKNNIVTLCQENRYFIESYFLGNNHEMIHELAWQRFPIQAKATIFKKFWESLSPADHDDILPIQFWKKPLSTNENADQASSLVLLIKADLIRRYPDVIIYALKTRTRLDPNASAPSSTELIEPIFKANLRSDMVAYGFNLDPFQMESDSFEYYFVLEEPFDLPNFGVSLEKDEDEVFVEDVEYDSAHYLKSIDNQSPPIGHSANFAKRLLQRPVQMVQLASLMLKPVEGEQ